ncbi:MAG: radical SAM protein [Polyangiaceae bacterium]|nr:radical SAM protein [Polyangiaceae bacterium]
MPAPDQRRTIRERLAREAGRLEKRAPFTVGLVYPSPYAVGMSSLGYQRIYRALMDAPGLGCERIFLPDTASAAASPAEAALSYESLRPLSAFPLLAVSLAFELELSSLVRMLDAAGIPALARERDERHAVVLAGGPLTFSNPVPAGALVDAIVLGEGETLAVSCVEAVRDAPSRREALARLAALPHVWVPSLHGEALPPLSQVDDALLPATSTIVTPDAELSDMFLIEPERGCSRGCTYCVMRRTTNGGMRLVPPEVVLERIPAGARRVGLVGAAVSDHPRIVEIVSALADRGLEAGLSSLRPERLRPELVAALRRVGYRTLTTALDGASQRLRDVIERRSREAHYVQAAELAREHGLERLKLYLIVGLPSETDADLDECARFVGELSRIVPVALGISPFVAKRRTPLDALPFAGVRVVDQRLARLRGKLRGRADTRATSARWAWVEHVLAQGGLAEGLALCDATRAGAAWSDFRRCFAALGHQPEPPGGALGRDVRASAGNR